MGDLMKNELLRSDGDITEDNSDGAFSNLKTFLGFRNRSEKIQNKDDIISQNRDAENSYGNSCGHTVSGEVDRAKRLEADVQSETYHAGFTIRLTEKNELVITKDEKKTLEPDTTCCIMTGEEDGDAEDDNEEEDDNNEYKLNHEKRGYMIQVINDYQSRIGATEDHRKMNEIGQKFGFECFNSAKTLNLKKEDMQRVLEQAQQTDHSDCDCFLFMISCHGAQGHSGRKNDEVDYGLLFADEEVMYVREIIRMFDDDNCPSLKGKPKLFFIQACRGPLTDDGNVIRVCNCDKTKKEYIKNYRTAQCRSTGCDKSDASGENNSDSFMVINNATFDADEEVPILNCGNDMLVMFAAPRGMMAWRNEAIGSWMIHHLHEVFMDYNFAQPKSLLRMLTKVTSEISRLETHMRDNSMNKKTNVPVIENKLTKDIIF